MKSPDNNILICFIWLFSSVTVLSVTATTFGYFSTLHKKRGPPPNLLSEKYVLFDLYKQAKLFHKIQYICFCVKFFVSVSALMLVHSNKGMVVVFFFLQHLMTPSGTSKPLDSHTNWRQSGPRHGACFVHYIWSFTEQKRVSSDGKVPGIKVRQ